MIPRQLTQLFQSLESFLVLALPEQPERAFVQQPTASEQCGRGNDLHRHGDAPCGRASLVHVLVDAVVDPEAHKGAGLVGDFEKTSKDTANRGYGELGDVARHCRCDGTASETGQDSASV